jgi:hypothetical protein
MTVWVIRDGQLVEKHPHRVADYSTSFPSPMISRIEAYESPVTGETISSWRQRDADMQAVGACDPRDLSGDPFQKRAVKNARRPDDTPFEWRGPSD